MLVHPSPLWLLQVELLLLYTLQLSSSTWLCLLHPPSQALQQGCLQLHLLLLLDQTKHLGTHSSCERVDAQRCSQAHSQRCVVGWALSHSSHCLGLQCWP